jgi:hypothetical protein
MRPVNKVFPIFPNHFVFMLSSLSREHGENPCIRDHRWIAEFHGAADKPRAPQPRLLKSIK